MTASPNSQQYHVPNNGGFDWMKLFLIIISLVMLVLLVKCNRKEPAPVSSEALRKEVYKKLVEKNQIIASLKKKDSVRIEHVVKWNTVKIWVHDTIHDIDSTCRNLITTLVNSCDSVIKHDSIVIQGYKNLSSQDSLIIQSYQLIAYTDSLYIEGLNSQINGLNKQIRKHKRDKKAIVVFVIIREGVRWVFGV